MEKVLGFTGTREGMTTEQKQVVAKLVKLFNPKVVHHGVCIGADEDFHSIVRDLTTSKIIGHLGIDKNGNCFTRGNSNCDEYYQGKYFTHRDKDIVDLCGLLIATPNCKEKIYSGTWTTVRMARKIKRNHIIIFPDGNSENYEF